MKRKYAAMVLGLALSVTSMNVFAAETEATQTEAAEDTADTESIADMADDGEADSGTVEISEETADSEEAETMAVWGEVTAAEEGSVTIKVADLQGAEDTEAAADAETDNSSETETETDAENTADETAASGAEGYEGLFTYTGEELNITLNEETVVQLIYQDADAEKMQDLAEEYSDTTAAAELTEAEEMTDEDTAEADTAEEVSEKDAAEADTAEEASEKDTEEEADSEADTADTDTAKADAADTGENGEEPIVAELSIDAVLEGDMIYATIDDSGNAVNVIVFMPESAAETEEASSEETTVEADDTETDDTETDETTAEADDTAAEE